MATDSSERASRILRIQYEQLRDATMDWNQELKLGNGIFGSVFRGMLKNVSVAIKRIGNHSDEFDQSRRRKRFKELIRLSSHFKNCCHNNVLPWYGYSVNGDELYLVSQLMLGGSLEQRLFNRRLNEQALTWKQRVVIAIGTCRGLQFLHTFKYDRKPLIHGDIKPANILLDSRDQPKIGDFGLASQGHFGNEALKASRTTRPYLPDEFILHHIISVKIDSYSFGIVLFQLATGLCAFERSYKFLANYIQTNTSQGTLLELMDKTPQHETKAEQIFKNIIDLGNKCTQKHPADRLYMVEADEFLTNTFMFGQKYLPLK